MDLVHRMAGNSLAREMLRRAGSDNKDYHHELRRKLFDVGPTFAVRYSDEPGTLRLFFGMPNDLFHQVLDRTEKLRFVLAEKLDADGRKKLAEQEDAFEWHLQGLQQAMAVDNTKEIEALLHLSSIAETIAQTAAHVFQVKNAPRFEKRHIVEQFSGTNIRDDVKLPVLCAIGKADMKKLKPQGCLCHHMV